MDIVLPGEIVPAQHVNLKLGPGLLQLTSSDGTGSIISSRAGTLNHSANRSKWWIEGNSRRVRLSSVESHLTQHTLSMSLRHRNLSLA
jgi:exosome complex component RRP40